jgi:integrase
MSTRVIFTPAAIDALAEGCLLDPATPGLAIEAGARNSKIWRYRRKVPGAESAFVRKSELLEAPSVEIRDGRWIIPGGRTKNSEEHPIVLAPWTAKLIQSNEPWIVTSPRKPSQSMTCGWSKVIERVRARMSKIGEREVAHFTLHDLRRTMRSHLEDHGIDEALAERMINHKLTGLAEVYNRNKRANAMAAGFLAWDRALASMAITAGTGEALEAVTAEVKTEQSP